MSDFTIQLKDGLRNITVLVIADDGDSEALYAKVKFYGAEDLKEGDEIPDSYRMMDMVFNTAVAPYMGDEVAQSNATIQ